MSDASDLEAARAEVIRRAQTAVDPVLTSSGGGNEVDAILASHKVASTWAASTAYKVGDVVMPNPRDGHRYKCIQAGTSGASQPSFSTGDYARTTDNAVVWEEAGEQFSSVYDVRSAIREAWELKAAKASDRTNFSADGASISAHQTPEFCLRMAQRYGTVAIA